MAESNDFNLSGGNPERLSVLFSLDDPEQRLWEPSELASLLRHQFQAPLLFDLGQTETADPGQLSQITDASAAPLATLRDLLRHPSPPMPLILLLNRFAKARGHGKGGALPLDVGSVLYHLSIALALLRHGQRITALDDDTLRKGQEWVLRRRWVEEEVRAVCQACLERVLCEHGD